MAVGPQEQAPWADPSQQEAPLWHINPDCGGTSDSNNKLLCGDRHPILFSMNE
jgi:hypothetical protein